MAQMLRLASYRKNGDYKHGQATMSKPKTKAELQKEITALLKKVDQLENNTKRGKIQINATAREQLELAFEAMGGVEALTSYGKADPDGFYKLWSKLLPLQIKADVSINVMMVDLVNDARARLREHRGIVIEQDVEENEHVAISTN